MPSALHDAAMRCYRQYLVVGGMPECVMQFAETKDYILVRHIQDTILTSYLNDMSKYNNLNEIKKTMPEPDGCQIPGVGIPVNQTHTAEKTTYIRQGFFCIV